MTKTQLQFLKPGDLVAWHYSKIDSTPPLVGTIKQNLYDNLTVDWGNGTTRLYKKASMQLELSFLELLSNTITRKTK